VVAVAHRGIEASPVYAVAQCAHVTRPLSRYLRPFLPPG
jgi:hypothetical protein